MGSCKSKLQTEKVREQEGCAFPSAAATASSAVQQGVPTGHGEAAATAVNKGSADASGDDAPAAAAAAAAARADDEEEWCRAAAGGGGSSSAAAAEQKLQQQEEQKVEKKAFPFSPREPGGGTRESDRRNWAAGEEGKEEKEEEEGEKTERKKQMQQQQHGAATATAGEAGKAPAAESVVRQGNGNGCGSSSSSSKEAGESLGTTGMGEALQSEEALQQHLLQQQQKQQNGAGGTTFLVRPDIWQRGAAAAAASAASDGTAGADAWGKQLQQRSGRKEERKGKGEEQPGRGLADTKKIHVALRSCSPSGSATSKYFSRRSRSSSTDSRRRAFAAAAATAAGRGGGEGGGGVDGVMLLQRLRREKSLPVTPEANDPIAQQMKWKQRKEQLDLHADAAAADAAAAGVRRLPAGNARDGTGAAAAAARHVGRKRAKAADREEDEKEAQPQQVPRETAPNSSGDSSRTTAAAAGAAATGRGTNEEGEATVAAAATLWEGVTTPGSGQQQAAAVAAETGASAEREEAPAAVENEGDAEIPPVQFPPPVPRAAAWRHSDTLTADLFLQLFTSAYDGTWRCCLLGTAPCAWQAGFDDRPQDAAYSPRDAGEERVLQQLGVACVCRKGVKQDSPNQDNSAVLCAGSFGVYSVFDGHGPSGHDVSFFVPRLLLYLLLTDPALDYDVPKAIQNSFTAAHRCLCSFTAETDLFDVSLSGTTASVVIRTRRHLYVGHVGDSRVVLARQKARGVYAETLTVDHKPTCPKERARIEAAGGEVRRLESDIPYRLFVRGRLYPGLAMSRAIGDTIGSQVGVSCMPAVKVVDLDRSCLFLILASDGVWEFISSEDAVQIVYSVVGNTSKSKVKAAADKLALEAFKRWIDEDGHVIDDITCQVVWLR